MAKNVVLWIIIAIVLMTVFNSFNGQKNRAPAISYTQFLEQVKEGNVTSVVIHKDGRIEGVTSSGSTFIT
ncbi:MAG TPA: ATP-dependent metalloprotease, partial [Chromatiaceae bacterium]|nr:ATP-dependent metalloprotease [Chromatiaceae bacterium]